MFTNANFDPRFILPIVLIQCMYNRELVTGPSLPSLESHVFHEAATTVDTHPESILYLTPQDQPREPSRERWRDVGPSAALRVESLDELVTRWYEHDQFKGRVTHIDRPLLFRLVELGVEGIESQSNPLYTGDRFPRSGLVQEAESLFTELEFAGLLSADAMRDRLVAEGVPDRAEHVGEFADAVQHARREILENELPDTYRTERMHHVVNAAAPPDMAFPSVEAVIVGGFTQFDALERELLDCIADTWPTIALLPLQTETDTVLGVDRGAERVLDTYRELGFTRTSIDYPTDDEASAQRRIVRSLFRHPEEAPAVDQVAADDLTMTVHKPATVPDEIRFIARDIRSRLGDGVSPDDVGVVLTSQTEYGEQLQDVFEAYDIPATVETDTPLTETALGEVVQTICELGRDRRTIDSMLDLLTSPLVSVSHEERQVDHRELTHVAARLDTNRLDSALTHIDDAAAAAIESVLRDIDALTAASLSDLNEELEELFDRVGVNAALDDGRELTDSIRRRERHARERLDRVVETLALTEPAADPGIGNTVDRLERALAGISIPNAASTPDRRVVVCPLSEALAYEFEHVYVLGMTESHVPSNPDQTAFAKPIYDSHPDFEQRDVSAEARYHLGAVLGSAASLQLSVPQRSLAGDPFVEADFLTELRRVCDVDALTIEADDSTPGCAEDAQRVIGRVVGDAGLDTARHLLDDAVTAGTFDTTQRMRMESGTTCAEARSGTELTAYDGRLSPEMVGRVHDRGAREPYSPSRLETYATCGFKYYMQRVLGIEAPDEITREPHAGDRGSFLHDVFEHYYLARQSTAGEPVHPGGTAADREVTLLRVALSQLDEAFDEYDTTGFHEEWLTKVLAGLGTSASNPYYGPDETISDGRPVARGLFYRFLHHEADELSKATARPTWFEARIGTPHTGGTPVQDDPAVVSTPHGDVPIHGLIDRVETVPGTTPTQLVVRDYKTGSTIPSAREALLGVKFQLPLYALMAENAFDSIEAVGGAYYQVAPPNSVNSRKGLVTSQEMAAWAGSDDPGTPLLRHSHPDIETHDAFRRFIEEQTPQRLGTLTAALSNGRFHPTVLDPSDAGCRYCDYADVCDVRPHQRRETMDKIEDSDDTVYVPPMARDLDVADIVEVE